ncbi:MAG: restriction endonuclease subunit S [Candidatus Gastranaerophilaceae bacterium]
MKNNFKTCYIGDICKINENTYSNSDKWNFVNYLDTGNITKNKIENIQFINLSLEKLPSRAKRKVKNNNIIYSTVRPNQKHFGIIEEQPENFLVSTGFAVLDVDCQKANPRFVYYYLTQENYTNALHAIAEQSTSAYPSIKPSDIGNRKIILPTLEVQNKIAKVLSALDNKIELNNSINNNLEQQAQAIFNNKFVNLETVPSNWQIGNLSGIADYLNGLAMQKFRPSEDEIGIPVLKIKELRQGFCDNQSDLCSPNIKSEYLINDGDVIFSWSGTLWH